MVHCTSMSIQVGQTSFSNKTRALRMLMYAVAIVVFAVLNPLACVWHCALQDLLMEHAAHNQRYVWICIAHADGPAVGSTNTAGGSIQLTGAGTTISAVHHAMLLGVFGVAVLVIVSTLGSSSPRRPRSTPLVPAAPPPKHLLHYA